MTIGRTASLTDPGRRRRRNEDAFVCAPPLFAVADGMGGAQAGEIASRLAAAALTDEPATAPGAGAERVAELIRQANRRVYEAAGESAAVSGMGTTITVALAEESRVHVGHVGDSRAYLVRDGQLAQLTDDHSLVAELVRSGKLTPEEAESHPQRSVITRALGTEPDVAIDTCSIEGQAGDLYLLCSDGLTSMVGDDEILELLERHRESLDAAARALVEAANRAGGEDNITVVLFELAAEAEEPGETASYAALEPTGDDEDTLSGLERLPAVDTVVIAPGRMDEWLAAEDAAPAVPAPAGAPQPQPRSRPRSRRLIWWLGGLALLAAAGAAAVFGLSRAHFVGAERDGHVAIYEGLPWELVGPVRLYRAVYVSPLLTAQLSQAERRRLFSHDLRSYSSARAELRAFEQDIRP